MNLLGVVNGFEGIRFTVFGASVVVGASPLCFVLYFLPFFFFWYLEVIFMCGSFVDLGLCLLAIVCASVDCSKFSWWPWVTAISWYTMFGSPVRM